jgi:hypothetical protein
MTLTSPALRHTREFEIALDASSDARKLMDYLYEKSGRFEGCNYRCENVIEWEWPDGSAVVTVILTYWPYPLAADDCVDFDLVLSEAHAVEGRC